MRHLPSHKAATSHPDLASADWSVKQAKLLNAEPNDAFWFFINRLWDPSLKVSELNAGDGKLCTFQFAKLRHSGELSLVVSYDGGGTADCNDVKIFAKGPTGIVSYDFDATQDLSFDSIVDINGDGHHELTAIANRGDR